MATAFYREVLSRKVVYPQNVDFVRTGKGEIYPPESIKKKVYERALQHEPIFSMNLAFILGGMAFCSATLALFLCESLRGLSNVQTSPSFFLIACSVGILACFAAAFLLGIYAAYTTDRDPQTLYFDNLMHGVLTTGKVDAVTPLPNGLTELKYTFNVVVTVSYGRTRGEETRHGRGSEVISASKIYEVDDEITILYCDEKLHVIL